MPIYKIYCNYKSHNNNYLSKHKGVAITLSQNWVNCCIDVARFFTGTSLQHCHNCRYGFLYNVVFPHDDVYELETITKNILMLVILRNCQYLHELQITVPL